MILFSFNLHCLLNDSSVAIPALILASINAKILWDEHWEHWATLPPLEERVEYDYQNIRTKKFPWGDGDKVRDRLTKPLDSVLLLIFGDLDALVSFPSVVLQLKFDEPDSLERLWLFQSTRRLYAPILAIIRSINVLTSSSAGTIRSITTKRTNDSRDNTDIKQYHRRV